MAWPRVLAGSKKARRNYAKHAAAHRQILSAENIALKAGFCCAHGDTEQHYFTMQRKDYFAK